MPRTRDLSAIKFFISRRHNAASKVAKRQYLSERKYNLVIGFGQFGCQKLHKYVLINISKSSFGPKKGRKFEKFK